MRPLVAAAAAADAAALTAWLRDGATATAFAVGCLAGPVGVGKMTVVRALAAEARCDLLVLTPDRYPTAADCVDQIVKWCTTQAFDDAFLADGAAHPYTHRAIVVDALDILLSTERTLLSIFSTRFKAKDVARWRPLRFLLIAPTAVERRVHEAFRHCAKFSLAAPTYAEARDYFRLYRPDVAAALCDQLAKAICTDVSASAGNVGNVAYALACLDRNDAQTRKDNTHIPLHHLWTAPMTRPDARALLEQDIVFHPLRFHENSLGEILRRRATVKERKAVVVGILRHLVAWDRLVAYALRDGHALAEHMAVEHAAGLVTGWLARLPARKAGSHADGTGPAFTKMLSNLSVQKKVQRRDAALSTSHAFFPLEHIGSYHV
jgi:hypothetical protein